MSADYALDITAVPYMTNLGLRRPTSSRLAWQHDSVRHIESSSGL